MTLACKRTCMPTSRLNWKYEQHRIGYLHYAGCCQTAHKLPSSSVVPHDWVYIDDQNILTSDEDAYVILPRQGRERGLAFQQPCLTNACLSTMPAQECIEKCLPTENRTSSAPSGFEHVRKLNARERPAEVRNLREVQESMSALQAYVLGYVCKRRRIGKLDVSVSIDKRS